MYTGCRSWDWLATASRTFQVHMYVRTYMLQLYIKYKCVCWQCKHGITEVQKALGFRNEIKKEGSPFNTWLSSSQKTVLETLFWQNGQRFWNSTVQYYTIQSDLPWVTHYVILHTVSAHVDDERSGGVITVTARVLHVWLLPAGRTGLDISSGTSTGHLSMCSYHQLIHTASTE